MFVGNRPKSKVKCIRVWHDTGAQFTSFRSPFMKQVEWTNDSLVSCIFEHKTTNRTQFFPFPIFRVKLFQTNVLDFKYAASTWSTKWLSYNCIETFSFFTPFFFQKRLSWLLVNRRSKSFQLCNLSTDTNIWLTVTQLRNVRFINFVTQLQTGRIIYETSVGQRGSDEIASWQIINF